MSETIPTGTALADVKTDWKTCDPELDRILKQRETEGAPVPAGPPVPPTPTCASDVWQHPDYPDVKIAGMKHEEICKALDELQSLPKGYDLMDADPLMEKLMQAVRDPKVHERYEAVQRNRAAQREHALLDSFTRTNGSGTILLEHSPIAAYLHELYHTISFNKMLFIYDKETGIYRQNAGDLEEEIRHIIESTAAKCSITRDTRDILAYLTATNRKLTYPFNQSEDAIPVKNGTLKLNFTTGTAELIPHSPEYLFTFQIPIVYDLKADGEAFHKTVLSQYVEPEVTEALYQIPAQAILQALGIGPFKKSYILQGNADGGKTSYLAWLHAILGLENIGHVSLHQIGTDPFVNADLESKILNTFDDMADVPLQNIGPFKAMTGGFDFPINKKHMQRYNGRIFAVHVFTCNAPPDVPEKILFDSAFWTRWEYLHFDNVFPIDPNFTTRTFSQDNLSGSFNRVIAMVFRIAKDGLVVNDTPSDVKDIWQMAADPFAQFINDHLPASSSEHKFDKDHLLASFQVYCKEEEINDRKVPSSQKALSTMAFKNGFKDARMGKGSERRRAYSAYRDWNPNSPYRESRA